MECVYSGVDRGCYYVLDDIRRVWDRVHGIENPYNSVTMLIYVGLFRFASCQHAICLVDMGERITSS